ncbi:hypothetical protein [Pyramidobacter sp. C12-8]|uniref:hypothetical protein n=2 Tax=unclassified Pyramidobacter TaxID=2632171 RepID=UPI00117A3FEC|nr:hypothetical protein [Pyramidobacter sp. C12-8]
MRMKKMIKLLGAAVLLTMGAISAFAASANKDEELMKARSVLLWIGGTRVGDLMVGADAKLQFQFVDRTLSARIYAAPNNFPDDIVWNASYIDKAARAKCNLVILGYRAMNRWNFDPGKLTVNGEPLPANRIYTSLLSKETGNLAPDTQDAIAFGVPRSQSRGGSEIVFGYEGYSVKLTIPER